jgi:hypothetical protein
MIVMALKSFYGTIIPRKQGRPVDFRKVAEAARQTGATEILGPPPFGGER